MLLKNKVIFLTGGAKGIGYHCAKAYAREGAHVIIADLDQQETGKVIAELGDIHLGLTCNVAHDHSVENAIRQSLHKYGRLDIIHNNAGIANPSKSLHETTVDEFDTLINVNLRGIYNTTRFGFPALSKSGGSILNTSSLVGEIGQEIHAAYSATKGAVNALTKSMALDYAKYKIRVNAVAPAAVWTPMLAKWNEEQPLEIRHNISKYLDGIHPIGHCPEGDVVADACVFLLSDLARFITGCIMPVSGGAELGYKNNFEQNHGVKVQHTNGIVSI